MIDPHNITNFSRTQYELEEFMLFCICVPNKSANRVKYLLEELLQMSNALTPFEKIKDLSINCVLTKSLHSIKIGQYKKLHRALFGISALNPDLRKCTPQELERIHGIGPKTSRYFILHSRPGQKLAVLDRHILNYLKSLGHDVPTTTPSSKRYVEIERIFLSEADKQGKTPAELDLEIWNAKARKSSNP